MICKYEKVIDIIEKKNVIITVSEKQIDYLGMHVYHRLLFCIDLSTNILLWFLNPHSSHLYSNYYNIVIITTDICAPANMSVLTDGFGRPF